MCACACVCVMSLCVHCVRDVCMYVNPSRNLAPEHVFIQEGPDRLNPYVADSVVWLILF